jgi:hypothetical protein
MERTILGGIVMAVGAVVVLLFLLADPVGITVGDTGFGWEEMLGAAVGAVVFIVGLALAVVEPGETRTPLPH